MQNTSTGSLGGFQRARRLALAILLVIVFAVFLFGQSMFPPEGPAHELIETIGIVLIVLGIAGRLWCTLYIGGRKASSVVADGPYSICRNPLYLFSSIAAIGVGAQMGSITVALGFGLACAAAFHIVILREEKYLLERHPSYRAYMDKVPRFFPNPTLYRDGDTSTFKPALLRTTLLDGLVFLLAMPVFEMIDSAQTSGVLPVLFKLP